MDLREQAAGAVDPAGHWYYRTKKEPLVDYASSIITDGRTLNLLDIGAGSCFFSESLIERFGRRIGNVAQVDTGFESEGPVSDLRIGGRKIRSHRFTGEIRDALIVMMDVLEHVEDDAGLLRSFAERCRGQVHFFITVPAARSLWSSHDVFLGHYRRYDLAELRARCTEAGITITSAYYLYAAIFPLVWLKRRFFGNAKQPASDLKSTSPITGMVLEFLCRSEFKLRHLNKYFGVTCVVEGFVNGKVT